MDYFGRRIRNRLRRVREGDIPGLTEKDCFDQQALLEQVLGEDRESTVFAIDHGDIKPGNIIVDDSYNIRWYIHMEYSRYVFGARPTKCESVIDCGFAALVPIARAAGLPRILWPTDSANKFAPNRTILKDRQTYIHSLSSYTSPAALSIRRWQTAKNVGFCTLYLESIFGKGMHVSMARIGWKVYCAFLGYDEEQS